MADVGLWRIVNYTCFCSEIQSKRTSLDAHQAVAYRINTAMISVVIKAVFFTISNLRC